MDLISCPSCAVVLDKNKIYFPDVYDHDTQEIIDGNSEWDGDCFIAVVDCPVCGAKIREK